MKNYQVIEKIDTKNYEKYEILKKNFIEFKLFINKIESLIENFVNFNNKSNIKIRLIFKENKENFIGKFKNINCKYEIVNDIEYFQKKEIFLDIDILNNNDYPNFKRFLKKKFFPNDSTNSLSLSELQIQIINILSSNSQDSLNNILNLVSPPSADKIIKFVQKIGKHEISANYVLELDNGYLISGGPKTIIFYVNFSCYKRTKEIKRKHNSIYPVYNEKKAIDLIFNSDDEISILTINNNGNIEDFFRNINYKIKSKFCFSLNKSYLICNDSGLYHFNDILGKIIEIKGNIVTKHPFLGGIKINESIIALTSNKSLSKGNDKLVFYSNNSKKIFKEINDYSFTKSQNNMIVIHGENEGNKKLLLCGCTKYNKNQKNGILLVTIQLDDKNGEKISEKFYETENIEIHCFCNLFKYLNKNEIFSTKIKKLNYTDYFFVAGFNADKKEAIINLYKIIYNIEDFDKTRIQFIKNIVIDIDGKKGDYFFNGFAQPITCMIQSKSTGKIIISNMDGNVYLFSEPNLKEYE